MLIVDNNWKDNILFLSKNLEIKGNKFLIKRENLVINQRIKNKE